MLTNVALNALKPGAKPYKKSDGGGLFILVEANRSKLWRFACRYNGKQKLLSGGRYPQTLRAHGVSREGDGAWVQVACQHRPQ